MRGSLNPAIPVGHYVPLLKFNLYAASKAALRSFARTWLNELKGRNIRVNVLSQGQIERNVGV